MPTRFETASIASALRPLTAAAFCGLVLAGCAAAGPDKLQEQATPVVSPEVITIAERAVEEERYADAKLLLERALLADPHNVRARLAMAEIQLAYRNLEAADKLFVTLADAPEAAARATQGHGIARLLMGEDQTALQVLQEAVEQDPSLWRAWNALGSLHDRAGDWEQASAAYDHAIAIKPNTAMLYNNRGFSRLLRRDTTAALADFGKALKLDPKLEAARENLRLALAWSGDYEQALVGVARKDIGRTFNNIGFVALLRGDLPAAESYLMRSMQADPSFNKIANRNLEYLRSLKAMEAKEPGDQG